MPPRLPDMLTQVCTDTSTAAERRPGTMMGNNTARMGNDSKRELYVQRVRVDVPHGLRAGQSSGLEQWRAELWLRKHLSATPTKGHSIAD